MPEGEHVCVGVHMIQTALYVQRWDIVPDGIIENIKDLTTVTSACLPLWSKNNRKCSKIVSHHIY